jgi:hypothetical protein
MGKHVNRMPIIILAAIGWLLLLAIAARTAFVTLPASIEKYREAGSETHRSVPDSLPAIASRAGR